MKKAEAIASNANDPCKKFLHSDGDILYGMSICTVDLSAKDLLAQLWILDTYDK